jgi:uncharacterized protein YdaU (DUF1376 family)
MAFDWPTFQAATIGMRRETKWSYFNAICAYYWGDCAGLPDDSETLRMVCECIDLADWTRTKGVIFGKFFVLEGGAWHQKRAREEYIKAQRLIKSKADKAKLAAAARWGKPDAPSNARGHAQAMPEECPLPVPLVHTHSSDANMPTWEEIKTWASMHGIPESSAKTFFDHHQGNNLWINQHGKLINWTSKLPTWAATDRAKPHANNRSNHKPTRTAPDRNAGTHNANRPAGYYAKAVQ